MSDRSETLVTVVVPAFNEESNLASTVNSVAGEMNTLGCTYEIMIVDDASSDGTAAEASRLSTESPVVRVVRHRSNMGMATAFRSGVAAARGEWIILVPADLAMDVRSLGRFLEMRQDCEIVLGIRSDRRDVPYFRRLVSWVNIFLIQRLFGMAHSQFNYIAMYKRDVLLGLDSTARTVFFHAEILISARDAGFRIREVQVPYVPRASGKSTSSSLAVITRTTAETLRYWWRWRRAGAQRQASGQGAG